MTALPKALIFDCDGTLAHSAELHFAAFNTALNAQCGRGMDWDWYVARGGLARPLLIAEFAAEHGFVIDAERASKESIAATVQHAALAKENPAVADLARAWAAQQRPAAVGTNAEADVVAAVLGACGLYDLFDAVLSLTEAKLPKPDPTMFLMAAKALDTAPEDCLVLEDSAQGMEAARRAGIPALDVREAATLERIAAMIAAL